MKYVVLLPSWAGIGAFTILGRFDVPMDKDLTIISNGCSQDGGCCCGRGNKNEAEVNSSDLPAPCGARLAWSSVGLFLMPLFLALLGAIVVGHFGGSELLGALGGLGSGMAGAILAARWIGHQRQGSNA